MNDQSGLSGFEDPELDRTLQQLGRFSPRQGFEDRVVTRVRVPLPAWLRRLRDSARAVLSGVSGWAILATFSLATAGAWGAMTVAGVRHQGLLAEATGLTAGEAVGWLRSQLGTAVLGPAARSAREAGEWLAASGLPLRAWGLAYAIVVVVSAVALWRLMAEPRRPKGTT